MAAAKCRVASRRDARLLSSLTLCEVRVYRRAVQASIAYLRSHSFSIEAPPAMMQRTSGDGNPLPAPLGVPMGSGRDPSCSCNHRRCRLVTVEALPHLSMQFAPE